VSGFVKCSKCEKLFESGKGLVEFVPNGETRWWRADARRESFPYHHQATHSRIGWPDETKRLGRPDGENLCYLCRKAPRPEAQEPIHRAATRAWEDAIRENPELAKMAPKWIRERMRQG
jgi:hypothetical protein